MSPSIEQRCETLNIDNNLFTYAEGMSSCIDIYLHIPELEYKKDKILLLQSILIPGIKQVLDDIYPNILIGYTNTDDMIQLQFNTPPRCEATYIDIIEHIIQIIDITYEVWDECPEHTDIQYDRAITYLRIL